MAERRMFAKTIIDSDAFLDMALSTQALYFHLSMRADDDGFLNNPKKVMRSIGASQNEMELLLSKKFILAFETGVIVIKHWKLHNYIQKDRYKPTVYHEEKAKLSMKKNNVYSMDTDCIQNGNTGKDRLGKDRLGKSNKKTITADESAKPKKKKFGTFKNVLLSEKEYNKLIEDFGETETYKWIEILSEGMEMNAKYKYKNHNLALRKWKKNEKQQSNNKPQGRQINESTYDTSIEMGF